METNNDDGLREQLDLCWLVQLDSLDMYINECIKNEEYDLLYFANVTYKVVSDKYVSWHLKNYDSEARKIIRNTYNILGYNPYNPKQLNNGDKI